MESVARNYAEALFLIAKEEDKVPEYQNDFQFVSDSIKENIELFELLKKRISTSEKIEIIDKIYNGKILGSLLNFLKLVVSKDKTRQIFEIANYFDSFCNAHLGVEEGMIYSTLKLSKEEIAEMEKAISKDYGKKVSLKNIVDNTLLGGVKVVINDKVYDSSIRNRLAGLGAKILKEMR